MSTANILNKIIANKKTQVARAQQEMPLLELQSQHQFLPRRFIAALKEKLNQKNPAVIAEIKKASPSKGLICEDFNPIQIAKHYAQAGAACLSVLTDKTYFQGDNAYLEYARNACKLPVLRKDFIIDEYQIYESVYLNADCILLIVAALEPSQLHAYVDLATELDVDVLIEVHDRQELATALATGNPLIGINNRDLKTFKTNIQTTLDMAKDIPADHLIVSESGIHTASDVKKLRAHGIHAFLVGESLMRASDPEKKFHELFG